MIWGALWPRRVRGSDNGRASIRLAKSCNGATFRVLRATKMCSGHCLAADLVVFPRAVGLSVHHALAYGVPVMAFERIP